MNAKEIRSGQKIFNQNRNDRHKTNQNVQAKTEKKKIDTLVGRK